MNDRNTAAYDFSRFEPQRVPQKPGRDRNEPPKPVLLPKKRKSRQEEKRESIIVAIKTAQIFSAIAVLMLFLGVYIFGKMQLDEINHEIAEVQSKIQVENSENTSLKMKLNSMASLDKVEDYAINKLGMVKEEKYQVECINLDLGDKVVIANGTTPAESDEDSGLWGELLSYFR